VDGDPKWYSWAYVIDTKARKLRILTTIETVGTWDPKKMRFEWTKPLTFELDGPEPNWKKISKMESDLESEEEGEVKPLSVFTRARLKRMMRRPEGT
jgi:hypothetical protein